MERNLKTFLLAQLWTKISMQLMITKPVNGACISDAARLIRGQCMQFKYPDGSIGVTPATGETPRDAAAAISSVGLNFDTVANNAIDCRDAGKTFSDADFNGFIEIGKSGEQDIPSCLFGLTVADLQNLF
jgi:hypothetical protein